MTNGNRKMALIIVDVQKGMFGIPGIGPVGKEQLLTNIGALIARARASSCPVIYVQQNGAANSPLERTKPGHEAPAQIAPEPSDPIIKKNHCGMFKDTQLNMVLSELQVNHLVICGMQTEFCVDTAIRTAVDRNFKVIVAAGAHATFDTQELSAASIATHHEALWAQAFSEVLPVHEIRFEEVLDAAAS